MDSIKQMGVPDMQNKLTDLSTKLQQLQTKSQTDMAAFEMRLREVEARKASIYIFPLCNS